jgi:hypothetical protein
VKANKRDLRVIQTQYLIGDMELRSAIHQGSVLTSNRSKYANIHAQACADFVKTQDRSSLDYVDSSFLNWHSASMDGQVYCYETIYRVTPSRWLRFKRALRLTKK